MKITIVTTEAQFTEATKGWAGRIACDTETYGKAWLEGHKLVGISMCPENMAAPLYIPVWSWHEGTWTRNLTEDLKVSLTHFFANNVLVGHNFTYDKRWLGLDGLDTNWVGDTRIMWHLASAPAGPRPYGLKDAQVELLGWKQSNEEELAMNVKAKGGSLKQGDHYMADTDVLAKYACLDAYSTIEIYKKLAPWFDHHDYWLQLSRMMAYNELLEMNSTLGINCDREGLLMANKRILEGKDKALKLFMKDMKPYIDDLEMDWVDRKCAGYKRNYNVEAYKARPDKWKRFNLNSDADKRELFYGKLGWPVTEKTETGLPSVSGDVLKGIKHPSMENYLKYEKLNTLSSNFVGPYLDSVGADNRLHPGFNICGTVSYRLSGFKPYLLNAPFDEKEVMRHLRCDEGWVGVHADLSAIEPTITAHYSEDPALLKVFKEGLGDIYLDLALMLFPDDKELQYGYNPNVPVTGAIKTRFAKQRKVAKIIQLAVQYTGTGHTVAKNLTKEGMPTSLHKAEFYVRQYWEKFKAVDEFNRKLKELNRVQGYLRNVSGRIIRVPNPEYKDIPNRFIQSSAHDVLVLWVLEIYRLAKERCIEIRPILLDCHDSTSNQVREVDAEAAKLIYSDSLNTVQLYLGISVPLKAETKLFNTLSGLKNEEEE